MKIALIGDHYKGFQRAIVDAGHELLVLPYWQWFSTGQGNAHTGDWEQAGDGMSPQQVNDRVLEEIKGFEPDLVIQFKGWMDTTRSIWPETIMRAKAATGCLAAYWSVDDPDFLAFWKAWHRECGAEHWDIVLTCSQYSVEEYRKLGVRSPHYFLPGFDTRWPVSDVQEWLNPPEGCPVVERDAVDLVVIGHPYWHGHGCDLGRAAVAMQAIREGLTVEIFGPSRENWLTDRRVQGQQPPFLSGYPALADCYKGLLPFEQTWRGVMRGKIVLNNHLRKVASGYGGIYQGYVNDKTPMIPGTGSLMLMDHQPGMSPGVFTAGEEFLEYEPSLDPQRCLDSAMGLIRQAVEDDDLRERVRLAGQQRAINDHAWDRRVEQLEQICEAL